MNSFHYNGEAHWKALTVLKLSAVTCQATGMHQECKDRETQRHELRPLSCFPGGCVTAASDQRLLQKD